MLIRFLFNSFKGKQWDGKEGDDGGRGGGEAIVPNFGHNLSCSGILLSYTQDLAPLHRNSIRPANCAIF